MVRMAPVFVVVCGLAGGSARASCWTDPGVTSQAHSIAAQSFSELRGQEPSVAVCHGSDFPPNVGGDYNSGMHRIRIPDWQVHGGQLTGVLQHELCHASVAVQGQDDGRAQGHGVGFMQCLIQRGWQYEAQRVAGSVPGAREALNLVAGGSSDGWQPPSAYAPPTYVPPTYVPPTYAPPQVQRRPQCQVILQQRQFISRHGQVFVAVVPVQVCY